MSVKKLRMRSVSELRQLLMLRKNDLRLRPQIRLTPKLKLMLNVSAPKLMKPKDLRSKQLKMLNARDWRLRKPSV